MMEKWIQELLKFKGAQVSLINIDDYSKIYRRELSWDEFPSIMFNGKRIEGAFYDAAVSLKLGTPSPVYFIDGEEVEKKEYRKYELVLKLSGVE